MSNTLTSVSKNLVHSFSISFVNGILNLSIWVIAPFFISPENLGAVALLLAFAMIGTTLIENSFSAGIMTFNIATVKESLPILYFNLLTLVIYIIIIFLLYPFGKSLLPFEIISKFDVVLIFTIPLLASFITIYENLNKTKTNFKFIAKIEAISGVSSFVSFIFLLQIKKDYSPLLISVVIKYVIALILYVLLHREHKQETDTIQIKSKLLFWFGLYILGEKTLTVLASYLDTFLVAQFSGLRSLGVYELFKKIIVRPIIIITNAFENMAMPYLVMHKNNTKEYNQFYQSYISFLLLVCFGFLALLVISIPILLHLLPTEYTSYIDTFYLLILYSATILMLNPIDLLLYSIGKSKIFFFWNISYFLPLVFTLYYAAHFGLNHIIFTYCLMYLLLLFLAESFVLNKNHNILTKGTFLSLNLRPVIIFVVSLGVSLLVNLYLNQNIFLSFVISSIIFLAVFSSSILAEKQMLLQIKSKFFTNNTK